MIIDIFLLTHQSINKYRLREGTRTVADGAVRAEVVMEGVGGGGGRDDCVGRDKAGKVKSLVTT